MRILYFSSREFWPPNSGGRLRDYQLARQLARHASVTYFGLSYPDGAPPETPGPDLPAPEDFLDRFVMVPKAAAYSPANLLRGLLGPTPVTVLNCMAPAITAALTETGRTGSFDSIQMEGVHLVHYLPVLRAFPKRPPVICDWHNIESELLRRYSETATSLPRKLYAKRTAALVEGQERALLSGCDAHTVVSSRERQKLQRTEPAAAIQVVENGVDTDYFGLSPSSGAPRHRILYAGSMDYHANIDAVAYFAREIWPHLREKLSRDYRFTIAGRSPTAEVTALAKLEGIEVTGTVPDLRPYYGEALAVVVPLRVGGGTRLKILEAMAAGVPVVSTTLGAEGLEANPGADLLIADDPAATVEAISLLRDRVETWERLAQAGRELVAQRYNWQALGDRLFSIHATAAERVYSRA